MKRGELYRVYKGSKTDTKNYRVFVIVSRQILIDSKYSTAICAPIYSNYSNLSTQIKVGVNEGLKHESAIHCDELISIPNGAQPQEARSILPNSLKTEIVITMNLREWRHFFKLRTSKQAHLQMQEIAKMILNKFKSMIPIVFDDIIY